MKRSKIFVSCSKGMEPILQQELLSMGYKEKNMTLGFRGVHLRDNEEDSLMKSIYKINYTSRIAIRVLLPITEPFACRNKDDLYLRSQALDWKKFIPYGKTFAIDSHVGNHSEFVNSMFASMVVKDGIADRLRKETGERPNVDRANPDVQLQLFLNENKGIISIDTSRIPLSRRNYRRKMVTAPLKETLAAILLRLSGFEGKEGQVLYDPCCGSGTFLTEAAMIATNTPSAYLRSNEFGFFYLPSFDLETWNKIKKEEDSKIIPLKKNQIFGTDIDDVAVDATLTNLNEFPSKMFKNVMVTKDDFRTFMPSIAPTILITNPPLGERLQIEDLGGLYKSLGDFMKLKCAKPSKGFILTDTELAKTIGLRTKKRHTIYNGGIELRLLEFDIY